MTDSVISRKHLAEDVAYWRARAEAAENRLKDAANFHPEIPPEPPIGTDYVTQDGEVGWRRTQEGWYCARASCQNCPAEWAEVWDGHLERGRSHWLRRLP